MGKMRIAGILCLALGALLLAAPLSPGHAEEKELKLGFMCPLSGPAAAWGLPFQRGTLMAAEDINKSKAGGVVVKGKTFPVRVFSDDDKYQPAVATTVAHRMIDQHGVKFIIGSVASPCTLAAQAVTEPAKVITLVDGATRKRLGPEKPYSFSIHLPAPERTFAVYGWLSKKYPEIKKHAGFAPNDEVGRAFVDMISNVGEYGWNTVAMELYERGIKDFYPLLNKVLPKKPDVLDVGICPPGDMALIIKQARQLGFKGHIVTAAPIDLDSLAKVAGAEATEGFICTAISIPGAHVLPQEAEFYERYMKAYGPPFMDGAMDTYNAAMAVKMVVEQTGTLTDTGVLAKALEKLDFKSMRGRYTMAGQKTYGIKHQVVYEFTLCQFQKGKGVNIARIQGVVP